MSRQEGSQFYFHGGAVPDAVDFRVFSLLHRLSHTMILRRILEEREDRTLTDWYKDMKNACEPKYYKF